MAILNPMTWDIDFFLLRRRSDKVTYEKTKSRITLASIYIATLSLSSFWLSQVTKYVPDPYLVKSPSHVPSNSHKS